MFKFHALRRISATLLITTLAISQPAISQPLSNQMDIRVLIDVSGSMKNTDPNNLRIPALQVLTQVLPEGSKAGVWQFADTPKVVVPLGEVNAQWQQEASVAAEKISSTGLYTDIGAALNAASFNAQDQTKGRQLHVILLTDGMVDVSRNAADNKRARIALLEPILQQYINVGARVHTVGLSYKADQATLSEIAQRTDGLFEVAVNADQLLDIFLRALDNTVVTQQVPVERAEQSFLVEQGIESMTIVVEKNGDENIQFKDGKQRVFSRLPALNSRKWQSTSTHDVIKIKDPEPGTWVLISDTATLKRINVVGKLQILLQQSHQNIKVGQRSYIDVQLANAQDVLLSKEQLQGFKLDVTMDSDGRQVFNQQKVFVADKKTRMHLPVLQEPGIYNITISVINGPIVRTINRSLRVHPLVALTDNGSLGAQNVLTMPVTKEVEVITESAPKVNQPDIMEVSNETASKALQALMVEPQRDPKIVTETSEQTTQVATQEADQMSAVAKNVDLKPKTISNKLVDVVNQLTAKLSSPEKATQDADIIPQDIQVEAVQSLHWRWYVVGGAAFVLFVLMIILRRITKQVAK